MVRDKSIKQGPAKVPAPGADDIAILRGVIARVERDGCTRLCVSPADTSVNDFFSVTDR
jgi:hypothetical protein